MNSSKKMFPLKYQLSGYIVFDFFDRNVASCILLIDLAIMVSACLNFFLVGRCFFLLNFSFVYFGALVGYGMVIARCNYLIVI